MKHTLIAIFTCCLLSASQGSAADDPFFPFENTTGSVLDPASKGWHREYENNNNYGENWFFLVQTGDDGVLFASVSITNLGLRTFDATCNVRFYSPNGEMYRLSKEYRRKDISGDREKLDLSIGPNRVRHSGNVYQLDINEKELKLSLTLRGELPGFQFGNGQVFFYENRSAVWGIGFNAPRAAVSGTLTVDGRSFNLEGYGYHDHSWSTIKVPTFAKEWYTLRLYAQDISIILHQIYLTEKFGGDLLCLGIFGNDGELLGTRDFRYEPLQWRQDEKSGRRIPVEFELLLTAGDYVLTGTVKEKTFLDSIDVLQSLSWPVRTAIKAFYTEPFLIRYLADCEIEMKHKNVALRTISASGVVETNVYNSKVRVSTFPEGY